MHLCRSNFRPCGLKTCNVLNFTSLISLILQPPFPMSDPHWLAGTTRRSVTGGLGTVGVFCRSCKYKTISKQAQRGGGGGGGGAVGPVNTK